VRREETAILAGFLASTGANLESLLKKLSAAVELDEDDCRAIRQVSADVRRFEPKQVIIGQGDRPEFMHLMVNGWAARYKSLPSGTRQIVGFLIPGDICDLHFQILGAMDHSVVAMSNCEVTFVSANEFRKLVDERPRLTRALWSTTLVDEAVLREWVLNAGRRRAYEATAHLLCEMHFRMEQVGLVRDDHEIVMPLTLEELGDALGITTVHMNRTLKRLREGGLIAFRSGMLSIPDVQALQKAAGFYADYLHIESLEERAL